MTDRTAISYLMQICSRRNITPQYDLEATGPVHRPTFAFKCTAGPYTFSGTGKSKKIAKHEAAFGVLQQILAAEPSPDHPEIIHSLSVDEDDPEMQNHVAKLQKMAQENKLHPPKYEYKPGPDAKDFVCVVTMAEMEADGVGISKKAAKKLAAKNLLHIAENSPYSIPESVKVASEKQEVATLSTESECINLEDEDPWILGDDDSAPHVVGLQLKNPEGAAVGKLRSADLDICDADYVEQLRSLAAEQDWTIEYHEIPSSSPEQHLMLVEVSKIKLADMNKSHTAVHHGMDYSMETCKNNTARNMLKYLKIMSFNED